MGSTITMKFRNSSKNPRKLLLLVAVFGWANFNAFAQSLRGNNPSHNNGGPWPYDHLPAYVPKVAHPRLSEPLTFSEAPVTKREAFRNAYPTVPSPEDGVKRSQQWPPTFPNSHQAFSGHLSSAFNPEEEQPMYGPAYMYPDAHSKFQDGQPNHEDNGSNEADKHPSGRYPEQVFQWRRYSP